MKFEKKYLKYIAIVLALVFVAAAGLVALEIWDRSQGKFAESDKNNGVLTYNGKEYVPRDNVDTLLVLGIDTFEDGEGENEQVGGVRADFLMLLVFNNDTKEYSAVQINRDTMTSVNKLSIGGTSVVETSTKQIALAYNYVSDDNDKIRCRNTKDSVEALLMGTDIEHCLAVTMDSVSAMNDFVGGVEVTVLDDFTGIDDTLVEGENVVLTGEQALLYVRTRYGLEDSSNSNRMERQQQYLNALYDKTMKCIEGNESFLVEMIDTMDEYVVYDSSDKKMQKFAEKFDEYEFTGIRDIEGESKLGEEYMEFYADEDSVMEILIDLLYVPKNSKK